MNNKRKKIEDLVVILVALFFVGLVVFGIYLAETERRDQIEHFRRLENNNFELKNCNPCEE